MRPWRVARAGETCVAGGVSAPWSCRAWTGLVSVVLLAGAVAVAADAAPVASDRSATGQEALGEQFAGDGALRGAPSGQAGTLAKPVWWQRVLDVETPAGVAWVAFGLLGQGAFMLRMLVQWWASEHEGRSVVPVGFWWISIAGATMLLTYFVWRGDPVGIVGQSMGFLVYARNLWLIHRGDRPAVAG